MSAQRNCVKGTLKAIRELDCVQTLRRGQTVGTSGLPRSRLKTKDQLCAALATDPACDFTRLNGQRRRQTAIRGPSKRLLQQLYQLDKLSLDLSDQRDKFKRQKRIFRRLRRMKEKLYKKDPYKFPQVAKFKEQVVESIGSSKREKAQLLELWNLRVSRKPVTDAYVNSVLSRLVTLGDRKPTLASVLSNVSDAVRGERPSTEGSFEKTLWTTLRRNSFGTLEPAVVEKVFRRIDLSAPDPKEASRSNKAHYKPHSPAPPTRHQKKTFRVPKFVVNMLPRVKGVRSDPGGRRQRKATRQIRSLTSTSPTNSFSRRTGLGFQETLSEEYRRQLARIVLHNEANWKTIPRVLRLSAPFNRLRSLQELKTIRQPYCYVTPDQLLNAYLFFVDNKGNRNFRQEAVAEIKAYKEQTVYPPNSNRLCEILDRLLYTNFTAGTKYQDWTVIDILGAGVTGITLLMAPSADSKTFSAAKFVKPESQISEPYNSPEVEYRIAKKAGELGIGPKVYDRIPLPDGYELILSEPLKMTFTNRLQNVENDSSLDSAQRESEVQGLVQDFVNLAYEFNTLGWTHGDLHTQNLMYGRNGKLYAIDFGRTLTTTNYIYLDLLAFARSVVLIRNHKFISAGLAKSVVVQINDVWREIVKEQRIQNATKIPSRYLQLNYAIKVALDAYRPLVRRQQMTF